MAAIRPEAPRPTAATAANDRVPGTGNRGSDGRGAVPELPNTGVGTGADGRGGSGSRDGTGDVGRRGGAADAPDLADLADAVAPGGSSRAPKPGRAGASRGVAEAYDRTGRSWEEGPARLVYDRMADVLVAASPVPLAGRRVLDVGAGTGAAARSIRAAGGQPVAVDLSLGMLRSNVTSTGRAVVADVRRLPVPTGAVDGLVAAFSFNHLPDPAAGFREAARVCRAGSPILAAAYAVDDHHPVKTAAEQALAEAGWVVDPWYADLRTNVVGLLATADGMLAAAHAAGLAGRAAAVTVDLPDLTPADLVAWRLGMAQSAPFLATLAPAARARVEARARHLLGPTPPPLRRSIVVLTALAP